MIHLIPNGQNQVLSYFFPPQEAISLTIGKKNLSQLQFHADLNWAVLTDQKLIL